MQTKTFTCLLIITIIIFSAFKKKKYDTIVTGQYICISQVGSHDGAIFPTFLYAGDGKFSIRASKASVYPLHHKFEFPENTFSVLTEFAKLYYDTAFLINRNEKCIYFNCYHAEIKTSKNDAYGFDIHACGRERLFIMKLQELIPQDTAYKDLNNILNSILNCD